MDHVLRVDHIPAAVLGWLCRSLGKLEEIITLIMLTFRKLHQKFTLLSLLLMGEAYLRELVVLKANQV